MTPDQARIRELEDALRALTASYEYHAYVESPAPDDCCDEYDLMMRPRWQRAAEVLGAATRDIG